MWREAQKNVENKKHTLQDLEYGRKVKKDENEKLTWQDLEYGK